MTYRTRRAFAWITAVGLLGSVTSILLFVIIKFSNVINLQMMLCAIAWTIVLFGVVLAMLIRETYIPFFMMLVGLLQQLMMFILYLDIKLKWGMVMVSVVMLVFMLMVFLLDPLSIYGKETKQAPQTVKGPYDDYTSGPDPVAQAYLQQPKEQRFDAEIIDLAQRREKMRIKKS
jgi:hypothetical protein